MDGKNCRILFLLCAIFGVALVISMYKNEGFETMEAVTSLGTNVPSMENNKAGLGDVDMTKIKQLGDETSFRENNVADSDNREPVPIIKNLPNGYELYEKKKITIHDYETNKISIASRYLKNSSQREVLHSFMCENMGIAIDKTFYHFAYPLDSNNYDAEHYYFSTNPEFTPNADNSKEYEVTFFKNKSKKYPEIDFQSNSTQSFNEQSNSNMELSQRDKLNMESSQRDNYMEWSQHDNSNMESSQRDKLNMESSQRDNYMEWSQHDNSNMESSQTLNAISRDNVSESQQKGFVQNDKQDGSLVVNNKQEIKNLFDTIGVLVSSTYSKVLSTHENFDNIYKSNYSTYS